MKQVSDMEPKEVIQLINGLITFIGELDLDGVTAITLAPNEKIDDQHLRDSWGVVQHLSDHGLAYPVEGPIKERADLKNYELREPQDGDFLMLNILRSKFPEKSVLAIQDIELIVEAASLRFEFCRHLGQRNRSRRRVL